MANIVLKTYAAGDDGQGTVTPQDDALIYQNAVPMNGLFSGGAVTLAESNVLHIASGWGIIGGRFFEINDCDISVELSSAGTLLGRVYVHLELTNADVPISIAVATGATLPALEGDANLNITNGNFDLELATFNVSETTISDIVNTYPTIRKANNQLRRATAYNVNDFVLCQSANNSLIFVCTTAGTTAVQQPMGYTTITDGNTITDGTAVFTAYSVKAAIIDGKAPKSHASTATTYGVGNASKYGHVKLSDSYDTINTSQKAANGVGASAWALQTVRSFIGTLSDLTTTAKNNLVAAINEVNTKVTKTEVLISNSGDAYSSSSAYSVGDYVIHDDKLYRCTTACSAGSWSTNSSCFTQDTLVNAVDALNTIISGSLTGTTYWNGGKAASFINKSGRMVIFKMNGTSADSSLPAGGYTKIGTVSFKPDNQYSWALLNANSKLFAVRIKTNGDIEVYNYSSTAQTLEINYAFTYFSND